jgi:hypothetical protein|tara:strand:+ start:1939 stop:2388 length:450 start_codon:yes stop_codon:yes gene_type:complete
MKKLHIQFGGEPILKGKEAYTVDDVVWCLDDNNVGHVYESEDKTINYQAIGDFEDGEYGLILDHYEEVESTSSDGRVGPWKRMEHVYYVSTHKAIIKDGLVDIDSVKEATAELLNRCGYWGEFIERLEEVDFDIGLLDRKKFINLHLGS